MYAGHIHLYICLRHVDSYSSKHLSEPWDDSKFTHTHSLFFFLNLTIQESPFFWYDRIASSQPTFCLTHITHITLYYRHSFHFTSHHLTISPSLSLFSGTHSVYPPSRGLPLLLHPLRASFLVFHARIFFHPVYDHHGAVRYDRSQRSQDSYPGLLRRIR